MQLMRILLNIIALIFIYMDLASQSIDADILTDSVNCFGDSSGVIIIKIKTGKPDYLVSVYDKRPAIKQKTLIHFKTSESSIKLEKLPAKLYYITIKDANNNYVQKEAEIEQPEKLIAGVISVEKGLSSTDASDAILKANPTGGIPPYEYKWNNKEKEQYLKNISQGFYWCEITDANGCGPVQTTITFNKLLFKDHIKSEN